MANDFDIVVEALMMTNLCQTKHWDDKVTKLQHADFKYGCRDTDYATRRCNKVSVSAELTITRCYSDFERCSSSTDDDVGNDWG